MDSAPKSLRGRKLPSPNGKNPKVPKNNGRNYARHDKQGEGVGDMDALSAYVPDPEEPPTRDVISPSKSGVAYLTENLIRRLTKEENISQVTSLHVTLGKDLNKKIKYIENLESLRKLIHLNLNNHMIEKLEKLDHLTQLRELHLANNLISKIEGVDCLVHLTVLNLNGNMIETLPAPIFKKLRELQAFHIAHNRLASHVEVTKLRPLQDLNSFSMEGNPMADMEHSHLFVIFQLRSLNHLDGKKVSDEDRQMADKRYAQEEVKRLEGEINRQKKEYEVLLEENCQALEELQQLKKWNSEQKTQNLDLSQKIKEFQRKLEAKEELLASKTSELSKACEKQFKLEQELAFYKLDAKFEHLGMLPLPEGVEFGDGEEDESPYIGKARFKPNKFARKSNIKSGEQHSQMTTIDSRPSEKYDAQNKQVQQEIHDALVQNLEDKERAIQQAEDVLVQLTDQVNRRRAQLKDAGDKLTLLQQAINDQAKLLGEEERKLIDVIADKKNYIRKLQEVAKELDERLKNISDELKQREAETEKLRETMRNTPPSDPAYSHLQARLAAKEKQLLELKDEYGKLKQDNERAKERLQEEVAAVKQLEAQLAALRRENGDQDKLKEELKNIIDDLNDNLNSMKQQVAHQAKQISQLQREKDALGQRLREMQGQAANNKQLKDNLAKLQQQLKLAEDALERETKNCDALRRRLSNAESQATQGSTLEPLFNETKNRLQQAEAEVARLQNALNKLKQQLQDDRRAADDRLKKEQEKVNKALQAARNAGDKDRHVRDLAAQVENISADNASLAQRLKDAEDELSGLDNLLDKGDVLERLGELRNDINRKRSAVREPLDDQDDLGRALAELHRKYLDLMRDLERERRKQPEGEIEGLQTRLQDAERALKQARDRASQLAGDKEERDIKLRRMSDELRKLKDKLAKQERMEDELEREKAENAKEMFGLEKQMAQLKDQLNKARRGLQDHLASARAPLQAKIEDMEDEMEHLQDKFNKVKAENERLKGALAEAEQGSLELDDRLAEVMNKLREARAQAEAANGRCARQKEALEAEVKALENELERARNRLRSLRAQADEKLQAEKEKAAAKIGGLEDEIDGLKERLKNLKYKAGRELDEIRDAGERKMHYLENKMADLRHQLDNERARADEQLRRAESKEAGLQSLLGETEAKLKRSNHQSQEQQAKLRELEDQIEGLRNTLKEAETQTLKDKLDKEMEAVKAERMRAAIQAAADKQLADAQQQVASLQSMLDSKDKQLQEELRHGSQNSADIAAQRAGIKNLASALAEQNQDLERLKDDLLEMSRAPVQPQYLPHPDASLSALANEVEALRAALLQREQQVQSLTRPMPLPSNPPFTTSGLVTTPAYMNPPVTTSGLIATPGLATTQAYLPVSGVTPVVVEGPSNGVTFTRSVPAMTPMITTASGLGTNSYAASPGQVHHHHYYSKSIGRGGIKPKLLTVTTPSHPSSEVLTASTIAAHVTSPVHHHHYNDVTREDDDARKKKKRKTKKPKDEVLFCNFPNHEGLEYEVGKLEGLLTSSQQAQKLQDQRDSLRMDLKELEHEVEGSLKRRAIARQSQRHSLDGNLAAGTRRVYIVRAVGEEDEENFPLKYLQQSSGVERDSVQLSSVNQMDDNAQELSWEKRLSDLARFEGLLQKRKTELQQMDAELMERRLEMDDVVHKRKVAEGHLRRTEEDAGVIEQRAAETSVELIRAGNQLINLEIKEKVLLERQQQINKGIEAKGKELKEAENSCAIVRHNVDRLNKELASKMEDLKNKETVLKDVETRTQLSLRVEELRKLIAQTETEEKQKSDKYVRALKEGEKALEEKTTQLARTRNELQTQMIQFHELNSKMNKLKAELKEIEENIKKGKVEAEWLAQRKEEERRIQDLNVQEAEEKLVEINNARNESMEALKSHREELGLLRNKIYESMSKIKEYEELKKQKEAEHKRISSAINQDKVKVENELTRLKSETQETEECLSHTNNALKEVAVTLQSTKQELDELSNTKNSVMKELTYLQLTLAEKGNELMKVNQEIKDGSKELEKAKETIADFQKRQKELTENLEEGSQRPDRVRKDSLPQESSTPRHNEKENELLVTRLRQTINNLSDENKKQNGALQEARSEVKEMRELLKSERENYQKHLMQVDSESEAYQIHLERLHAEFDAEKEKHTREKNLLLNKADEHRVKAKKFAEELNSLKQNHFQTKQKLNLLRETLVKDMKELKEHIEGMTTEMKSELARSLKQVENSKEAATDEFERLRDKKEEMEVQFAALQQSINSASSLALKEQRKKNENSKREKEDALIKEKGAILKQQQNFLRAQIRKQMSTRADILEEERKKAEASLEGLKSKLKNLEEVISRKDVSVQDFRYKLLRDRVETEKAADSNKQIDELRRRLRLLEDEKDLITSQRNHLVALHEEGTVESSSLNFREELSKRISKSISVRPRRSLDSLTDGKLYVRLVRHDVEVPCRDVVGQNTSLPLSLRDNTSLDRLVLNTASRDVEDHNYISSVGLDYGKGNTRIVTEQNQGLEQNGNPSDASFEQSGVDSSLPMLREDLSDDFGDKDLPFSAISKESKTEKLNPTAASPTSDRQRLVRRIKEQQWKPDRNALRSSRDISSSTFAEDKKIEGDTVENPFAKRRKVLNLSRGDVFQQLRKKGKANLDYFQPRRKARKLMP